MTFTSDEVNYLVYRYLEESGFHHSAFTFGTESNVFQAGLDGTLLPRGALISIIQKGVFFAEAELFNLIPDVTEDGGRLEKAVGSIPLFEAVLSDVPQRKAFESRLKETSPPTATPNMPSSYEHNSSASTSATAVKSEPTHASSLPSTSTAPTTAANHNGPSHSIQSARDRDFRAQQSANSGPLNGGPPPRGPYRTHTLTPTPSSASTSVLANHHSQNASTANYNHLSVPIASSASSPLLTNGIVGAGHDRERESRDAHTPGGRQQQFLANGNYVAGHGAKLKAVQQAAMQSGANGTVMHGARGPTPDAPLVCVGDKWLPQRAGINAELEVDRQRVVYLKGHSSEVSVCAWNPKYDLIASGASDDTARIWNGPSCDVVRGQCCRVEENSRVLQHSRGAENGNQPPVNKDVTSLDWNATGELLATGCYDGYARVWNTQGQLMYILENGHKGPIFALKWNPRGDRVLSAGVDKSTIVWEPTVGGNKPMQQFRFHANSALDVDWINDDIFASCSTDRQIHLCQIGIDRPLKTYQAHGGEVNAVKFDRVSQLLASCSDDMSLKIWNLQRDVPVYDIKAHEKEIYTIRWSPLGHIIASASFDTSIRLWDFARPGSHTRNLLKHTGPVYSVAFSPDARLIASGSNDKCVHIWDVANEKVVMSYTGAETAGGIFEVDWSARGDRVAASASDGTLIVFDIRNLKAN